jgi:GDP-4-dehydro-6-deoxy-D-mannose reductase
VASPRHGPVLITGASGFVGAYLLAEFATRYPHVKTVGVGALPGPFRAMDLRDQSAIDAVLKEIRPSAVIHLAAVAAPAEARADPELAWSVNVDGTRRLATAVLRVLDGQCRFIQVGSAEAYGATFNASPLPVKEDQPLQPVSPYGATKAAADVVMGQLAYEGLEVCRFRPFNHTGPGQIDHYVIPAFARQIALIMAGQAEPKVRVGNLDAARDFLDVRDVVQAYAMAAMDEAPFPPGSVYNLSRGEPHTMRDLLDRLIRLSGHKIEVVPDASRFRPNDIAKASGNPTAAFQRLGWAPTRTVDDILRDVLSAWLGAALPKLNKSA